MRTETLLSRFLAAGAQHADPAILQPAATLLNIYGEGIAAQSYVTTDPLTGPQILRPDFTVPVAQSHIASGEKAARYAYSGKVFRQQDRTLDSAREYVQVGYEVFGTSASIADDAEVCARISSVIEHLPLTLVIGDVGILRSAITSLSTTNHRKTALLRHIWRPARFQQLLDQFAGTADLPAFIGDLTRSSSIPLIGGRSPSEIEARALAVQEDARCGPIPAVEVRHLEELLRIRGPVSTCLLHLRELAKRWPNITQNINRMNERVDALRAHGIDANAITFDANFELSSLEYYDGFVFGFFAEHPSIQNPVAIGGRYDALLERIHQGTKTHAVGAAVHINRILQLEARQ